MNRRDFHQLCTKTVALGVAGAASVAGVVANAKPAATMNIEEKIGASRPVMPTPAGEKKLHVTYLMFDGVTALDFIGPSTALSRSLFDIDFVAQDKNPIYDDNGLGHIPTATFADIQKTDILCVPGTANPYVQLKKDDMLEWLAKIGPNSTWVTSVCTGSLILGAAGLLKGYKASAHWTMIDDLAYFGAIPTHERVVKDRNRLTGGGITSGIDFGLTLLATLKGEALAESVQLSMEYDPNPPFKSGSPKSASAEMVAAAQKDFDGWLQQVTPERQQVLEAAAKRLSVQVAR